MIKEAPQLGSTGEWRTIMSRSSRMNCPWWLADARCAAAAARLRSEGGVADAMIFKVVQTGLGLRYGNVNESLLVKIKLIKEARGRG